MFDTIHAIHYCYIDKEFLNIAHGWTREIVTPSKNNNTTNDKKQYNNIFKIHYKKKLNNIIFRYYIALNYIKIEFSIPKLLYNKNSIMFNILDYPLLISTVNSYISNINGLEFKNFEEWKVTRLDICYNFIVHDTTDKQVYIDTISKISLGRYDHLYYSTTKFMKNKSAAIRVYDKYQEMIDKKRFKNIESKDEKILRLEIQYRIQKLKRSYKRTRMVKDMIKVDLAEKELNMTIKRLKLHVQFENKNTVIKKINNQFSTTRAKTLINFVEFINKYGLEHGKNEFSYYYRNYADLLKNNINPLFLVKKINNPITFHIELKNCK